jgi:hypothetical protein
MSISNNNLDINERKLMLQKLRKCDIRMTDLEIRISEVPLMFIKERMMSLALGILYHNNNIDDILTSKKEFIKLGKLVMTKNEFKIKYSKMCKGLTFVSPSDILVKYMIRIIEDSDFSTVDPRSVILFAKKIIENYEDIMKKNEK